MTGRSTAVVLAVTLCIGPPALAACSGSSGQAAPAGTTSSSPPLVVTTTSAPSRSATTASPSPSQPLLPDAAKKPTLDGAEAFVRYVWAITDYSYAAQDTSAFRKISAPDCKFCKNTIDDVAGSRRKHVRDEGGQVSVKTVLVPPADPASGIVVTTIIDQAASRVVEADGRVSSTHPVDTNLRIDLALAWNPGAWILLGAEYFKPTRSQTARSTP